MKKKNKLQTIYNKILNDIKDLNDDEIDALFSALYTGRDAWNSLSALKSQPVVEKQDSIDLIDDDLDKKTRKKK